MGGMGTKRGEIVLARKDRAELEAIVADGNTRQKIVKRARIVLLTADGLGVMAIMREAKASKTSVWRWQERFAEAGVAGLLRDRSKKPGKKPIAEDVKQKVLELVVKERPANATHWSVRMLGEAVGISHTSVQRILEAHGLKPHLTRTFKVSNDPDFSAKVKDIVGLYMNPPDKAIVLSVDEKSQIQALDRTQPILPLRPGYAERHTHDYIRHGTATLFAALSIADGKVIGSVMKRHRHQEFIRFLEEIDRSTPKRLDLHLVLDNYGTHSHPAVYQWLARHRRFHFHFIPTSSSWLNQIECWFSELTEKRIRRGTFRSVRALVAALEAWIRQYNKDSGPFRWTAKPSQILAKIAHSQEALVTGH